MPRASGSGQVPPALRPFVFQGLTDLRWREGDAQATATCPFCGREGKFSIEIESGKWRCFVCSEDGGSGTGGGNAVTFLRLLWERSDAATNGQLAALAEDLGLLYPDSLMRWGVCWSILGNCWLVPGYGADGKLCQLYKYVQVGDRWTALPTPEMHHRMHGVLALEKDRDNVHLCEGWKDGVAWWEVLKHAKPDGDDYKFTAAEPSSVLATTNVLALQSCGAVGKPLEKMLPLFSGKRVLLMFDSDHPKLRCVACSKSHSSVLHAACPDCGGELTGKTIEPAGFEATKRATRILSEATAPPKEILWVAWGPDGYDPELPDGYDVRDSLEGLADPQERVWLVRNIMRRVEPVPAEWLGGPVGSTASSNGELNGQQLAAIPCGEWGELINSWRKATQWRQEMADVLSLMLAVCLSTQQRGNQLCLYVIAPPGSAKTQFCDALLTSKNCMSVESLKGFLSGWRSGAGEDFSMLKRMNGKTLVTAEGNVLMELKNFDEIMAQMRRIFDGKMTDSYKTLSEDRHYSGMRTPWIVAMTPGMVNGQAKLGDRFLRVCINAPEADEVAAIQRKVGYTAFREVLQTSGEAADTHMDDTLSEAYQLTGGYVDWLRGNAPELLARVQFDEGEVLDWLSPLAEFVAMLRSGPDPDPKKEIEASVELPTRLTHQFCRLAICLAVVLGRWRIDEEVARVLRKCVLDTASGPAFRIAKALHGAEKRQEGVSMDGLIGKLKTTKDRTESVVRFLRQVKVVEMFELRIGKGVHRRYRLTPRMMYLWEHAMNLGIRVS